MGIDNGKNLFNKILEAIPDAVIIVDQKGRITGLNSRTLEFLGYAPNELLGQSMNILLPSSLKESHKKNRESFYKNPSIRRMGGTKDLTILHRDGVLMPVDISLSPLESEGSWQVMVVIHDIRERKAIEAALKENEEKYRLLVENASEIFYQVQVANEIED